MHRLCEDYNCKAKTVRIIDAESVPIPNGKFKSGSGDYSIDFWREMKRRWMVGGVLLAVLAAVLSPRLGAPGGNYCMLNCLLHTQYSWFIPLSYIYYSAGRRAGRGALSRTRLLCVSSVHACLLAPALAVVLLVWTEPVGLPPALLQGVLVSCVGGGCSWLSLAVCEDEAAPLVTALSYAASLVATPLALMLLCGRAAVPPISNIAETLASTLPAFAVGVARGATTGTEGSKGGRGARICALLLLYVECCSALTARGAVRPWDLMAVLFLELSWVFVSACLCYVYARCGLVCMCDARVVALCAVPRSDAGWHAYASCVPGSLSRLPAAFLPPAQALLLAALPTTSDVRPHR